MAGVVLTTFMLLVSAAVERPVLRVPAEEAPDTDCAANAALAEATRALLADVTLVRTGALSGDALSASLARDAQARWLLLVEKEDGDVVLSRVFEATSDCRAAADAAAVILDRYLTDISWSGRAVEWVRTEVAPPTAETATANPEPPRSSFRGFVVSAGPTLRMPVSASASAGVEAAFCARLGEVGFAELGGWVNDLDTERVLLDDQEHGTLQARPFAVWVGGGGCLGGLHSTALCAGPTVGVFALSASASGQRLYRTSETVLFAPEAGLGVRLSQPLGRSFEVSLAANAAVPLTRIGVAVEGTSARLGAPDLDLRAGLRLGWRKF